MKRLILLVVLVPFGCAPELGEGDVESAREVVYDKSGLPAFAGQAIMIQSCGAGGHCHSPDIDPSKRLGAPAGLTFDLTLASTTVEQADEETQRLSDDKIRVLDLRGAIWEQVLSGQMPPGGEAGRMYHESVATLGYDRFADDGVTFTPLPTLNAEDEEVRDEAREILRNWLAAGAEVIERTEQRDDDQCFDPGLFAHPVGTRQPACDRRCIEATWGSIYQHVIRPSCALSQCHDHQDPQGDLDLLGETLPSDEPSLEGASRVRARLLEHAVTTTVCREEGRTTTLVPGEPEESLFYLKVAAPTEDAVCGGRMPASGNPLTPQELCAIRSWIECGACEDADLVDDGGALTECGRCLAEARTDPACNFALPGDPPDVRVPFDPADSSPECAIPAFCSNEIVPTVCDE